MNFFVVFFRNEKGEKPGPEKQPNVVYFRTISTPPDLNKWGPRIAELEAFATYPLGEDSFKIDHGNDYFAFFKRLGEVSAHLALGGHDEVLAVCISILRNFKDGPAFYLCDLKVHPQAQGKMLPLRLFKHAFAEGFSRCRRGYAISMNPGDGSKNRVVALLQRFRSVDIQACTRLNLYSLSPKELHDFIPVLLRHRGPCRLLSLRGIKDIFLQSTQQPMPLFHLQFGEQASSSEEIVANEIPARHPPTNILMFCTPQRDNLDCEAQAAGLSPSASATLLSVNMAGFDWRDLLTSDI